ncbi:MAG TPA: tetratricopeptide repeat protein, partial [Planctomycetaceae bacterium]|nr:tetratricopeptide repeat protein [Planctomycetaceae bacterium]
PDQAANYEALAEILWDHGMKEEAARRFRTAVKLDPANRELRLKFAEALFATGRGSEAKDLLIELSKSPDVSPVEMLNIAETLNGRGYAKEAVECARRAVAARPDNAEIRRRFAWLLLQQKRFSEALDAFEALRKMSHVEAHIQEADNQIIRIYDAMGILLDKIDEFEKKLQDNPNDLNVCERLAKMLYYVRSYDTALERFEQCCKIAPKNPRLLRQLALRYEEQQRLDRCAECYRKLVKLDPPRAPESYRKLSRVLARMQDEKGAIDAAKKVVEMKPRDPKAHAELAKLLAQFKRLDEAWEEFRNAIALRPQDSAYRQEFAEALFQHKQFEAAAEQFRAILDTTKESDEYLRAVRR